MRPAPQLLLIPDRDRVITMFMRAVGWPVGLRGIELERRQTLAYGDVAVLSVFVDELSESVEHVMRATFSQIDLEGAAQMIGERVAERLSSKGISNGRRRTTGNVQLGQST